MSDLVCGQYDRRWKISQFCRSELMHCRSQGRTFNISTDSGIIGATVSGRPVTRRLGTNIFYSGLTSGDIPDWFFMIHTY